jgi:hypothetical protein
MGTERLDRKGLPPTRGALCWECAITRKPGLAKSPDIFPQAAGWRRAKLCDCAKLRPFFAASG